jgi:hypothetical protein
MGVELRSPDTPRLNASASLAEADAEGCFKRLSGTFEPQQSVHELSGTAGTNAPATADPEGAAGATEVAAARGGRKLFRRTWHFM